MADAEYDGYRAHTGGAGASAPRGPVVQKWTNAAGALTSVGLVLGLAVWGYDLAVRDVRGVPVIRALEGPARIAPENPGGETASYQGMAVNEIAAEGTAGDAADRLTLAPRVDGLAAEDAPMGALAASADIPVNGAGGGLLPAAAPALVPGEDAVPVLASLRPDEPLPDGAAEPMLEALPGADAAVTDPVATIDTISTDVPGVAQSLRPAVRPGTDAGSGTVAYDAMAEAAAAAVAEALAPVALDVAPETLAEGTRLVQIGAYPSEADARLEWDKTAARMGALLDGKRRVIEPATTAGETFYRLRVEGFSDLDDARRFCAAFKAEGVECVPAAVR